MTAGVSQIDSQDRFAAELIKIRLLVSRMTDRMSELECSDRRSAAWRTACHRIDMICLIVFQTIHVGVSLSFGTHIWY